MWRVGEVTKSAHPARFSPDDKYSRHESRFMVVAGEGLTWPLALQAPCYIEEALLFIDNATK